MNNSFRRIETKYIITAEQREKMIALLEEHCDYDPYCVGGKMYSIMNIYYDTPDQNIISRSIYKPNGIYKEKLRARSYVGGKTRFLEIKKKYDGVVGKRRIKLTSEELNALIDKGTLPEEKSFTDKQILKEIQYFISQYPGLKPNVFLAYDRLGFADKIDPGLRITFDENIRCSRDQFNWEEVDDAKPLLPKGIYILEIKTSNPYPLWLAKYLSEEGIYHHSFSKYGTEYKKYLKEKHYELIPELYI